MWGKKKKFISQEYSTERRGKNIDENTKGSRAATVFAASFFSMAIVIGIGMITFTIIFFFAEVLGTSMRITLNATGDTDSVLVNRYAEPEVGDIVVVKHFDSDGVFKEYHIKRLIALGGSSISFERDAVAGRYVIQVDGVELDMQHPSFMNLYGLNPISGNNYKHADFETWLRTGYISNSMKKEYRSGTTPGFRDTYTDKDGKQVSFRTQVTRNGITRWELKLPEDYIFYMGDNRGGTGSYNECREMSADGTFFGPQPSANLVGTVSEVVHDKTAPEWVWQKIVNFFTFKW